jgi:N-acetyl-anhydromuramyl-L-alanine amidase AmpD
MREIILTEELPSIEYYKAAKKKQQIVLHHTVSSTGKHIDDWWKSDQGKSKIATAFVVDKNGDIYQLFSPEYWAWHIGGNAGRRHNEQSIGIEVVNEGQLFWREDDTYWWWVDNDYPEGRFRYEGSPITLSEPYRGFLHFASYTKEQVDSTHDLIFYLFDKFPEIPRRFINTFDYREDALGFKGVVMHVNLRETGKWDLSPAWNIESTMNVIEKKLRLILELIQVMEYLLPVYSV